MIGCTGFTANEVTREFPVRGGRVWLDEKSENRIGSVDNGGDGKSSFIKSRARMQGAHENISPPQIQQPVKVPLQEQAVRNRKLFSKNPHYMINSPGYKSLQSHVQFFQEAFNFPS
jgi:hypothetical protein